MDDTLSTIMTNFKQAITNWERSIGLSDIVIDVELLDHLINLSKEELSGMTCSEVAEHAFELSKLAMHVQRKENQCYAFIKWADAIKNKIFGDDKSRLHALTIEAEAKRSRIIYLAKRIEFMANCLMSLQRAKYQEGSK